MMTLATSPTFAGDAMKRHALVVVTMGFLLLPHGASAGDKAAAWKPFLGDEAYKVLSERSIKAIEEAAKSSDKNAYIKAQVEAAILGGYTLSVKDPKDADVSTMRGAALFAGRRAKEMDVKALAKFGTLIKGSTLAPADFKSLKPILPELGEMMDMFRNKSKGGEGLYADLQYQPKLKNLNGTEALIGALSAKKLSDTNLDKVAKELPHLSYRMAVVAALTHEMPPEKGAGEWRNLSLQMRDASIALAESAQKKNAEGIQKAATSLESSCTQCHSAFKSK
jgi:hypothetical protein